MFYNAGRYFINYIYCFIVVAYGLKYSRREYYYFEEIFHRIKHVCHMKMHRDNMAPVRQ